MAQVLEHCTQVGNPEEAPDSELQIRPAPATAAVGLESEPAEGGSLSFSLSLSPLLSPPLSWRKVSALA